MYLRSTYVPRAFSGWPAALVVFLSGGSEGRPSVVWRMENRSKTSRDALHPRSSILISPVGLPLILEDLRVQTAPDDRETAVIRGGLGQVVVQELPYRERIGTPGGDAAFAR